MLSLSQINSNNLRIPSPKPFSNKSYSSSCLHESLFSLRVIFKSNFHGKSKNSQRKLIINAVINSFPSNGPRFEFEFSNTSYPPKETNGTLQKLEENTIINSQNKNVFSNTSSVVLSENKEADNLKLNEYEYDLEIATRAIQLACKLSIRIQKQILSKEEIANTKEDQSLVTVADWGVQAIVSWVLHQSYPHHSFSLIAEEDTEILKKNENNTLQRVVSAVNDCLSDATSFNLIPPAHPLQPADIIDLISSGNSPGGRIGRHWVLDPVDGTLGFVRGDQYAIALGLLDEGEVVLGVLACPNLPMRKGWLRFPHRFHRIASALFPPLPSDWVKGCVLRARKGGGTWMQPLSEDGEVRMEDRRGVRVFVSQVEDALDATFVEPVQKANTQQSFSANLAENIGLRNNPLRVYSMAKYAAIARGDAEIFMKFARSGYKEKIWDHAAGLVIVEEAGGKVTDAGGNPLDFSNGIYLDNLDRGIIACCNPGLLSQLLDAVDASWTSSRL